MLAQGQAGSRVASRNEMSVLERGASVLVLLATACAGEKTSSRAADTAPAAGGPVTVPPVVLPDLSRISASARNNCETCIPSGQERWLGTARDLARVFGDWSLLMATGYGDAAGRVFSTLILDRDEMR